MNYNAEMTIDVTFHSRPDLTQYLGAAHIPHAAAGSRDLAWAILAGLSEYAAGTLHGLHLTGRGTGRLLRGYPQRVSALARHATGTITVIAEDNSRWEHQLTSRQVLTFSDGATALDLYPAPPAHGPHQPGTLGPVVDPRGGSPAMKGGCAQLEELVLPTGNASDGWR